MPYTFAAGTAEHFGKLNQFGLAQVGDRVLLVNRTSEGKIEVHEDLVFHFGVVNAESWSLPIAARRGSFVSPAMPPAMCSSNGPSFASGAANWLALFGCVWPVNSALSISLRL